MKLTYRDRIILMVVIALVILVGGFVGLVKPRYDDIKASKEELNSVTATWEGLDAKIQEIPTLKDKITEVYNESKKLSDDFYLGYKEPEELDKFMQGIVDNCNLQITNLEVGEAIDETLEYYYYTPTIPTTAIFDLADINGEYTTELALKLLESSSLALRQPENLLVQQYGINFKATKENIWKFMDEINKLDKSIVIESVSIADTDFGTNPETKQLLEEAETQKDSTGKEVGISQATIIVNLYSVYELDEPVLE